MPDNDEKTGGQSRRDLAARPLPFGLLWGAPVVVMLATNFLPLPIAGTAAVLAACLLWMGLGCAINARRCHRRHCYYASPVLLTGAMLTLLLGTGVLDLGRDGLIYITWGTFALVALTFLPEKLFGKYRH